MKYSKTKQVIFLKGTQRKILDTIRSTQNIQFIDLLDQNNNTALHYAVSLGYGLVIKQYLRMLKNNNLWIKKFGNDITQQSIRYKIKTWLNAQNNDGLTGIHYSALKGYTQIAQMLENAGARVDKTTKTGLNVFSLAAQQNKMQSILYFKGKIDSNASDHKKCTALHWATYKNHITIVKYLTCQNKIQIDFQQEQGRTALHIATLYGYTKIVQILLMAGANRNIYDKQNKLPKDYAQQLGNYKILHMLTLKTTKNCKSNYTFSPIKKQSCFYIILIFIITSLLIAQNYYINQKSPYIQFNENQIKQNFSNFIHNYSYYLLIFIIILCIISLSLSLYIHFNGSKIKQYQLSYLYQNIQISQNYCFYCKIIGNQQIQHCYQCNQCIYHKMKHNNIINCCIGIHNIKKYILCIICIFIIILIQIIMGINLINYVINQKIDQYQIYRYIIIISDIIIIIPLIFCIYQIYKCIKYKNKMDTISAIKKLSQSTFDSRTTLIVEKFKDISINKSGNLRIKSKRLELQE